MEMITWIESLMTRFGAGWVLWLLFGLSVLSVAVMLERAWLYWSLRDNVTVLAQKLREHLRKDDYAAARALLEASPSAEAAVVLAGLLEADRGPRAAEEAMQGAAVLQRMKLERRLAYLGTLGNNAPFIGLFGTVIGIVVAFHTLGSQGLGDASATGGSPQAVMAAIAEALVATAVGILVAIPAVATNNYFMRHSKGILANTSALGHVLLAHLNGVAPQSVKA